MSIVIDLIILAILALCVLRHYKLGLVCSLLTFGKFILALILASALRAPLGSLGLAIFAGDGQPDESKTAFASMIAYVVVFAAVVAISSFIIDKLKNIKIPIITKFDKLLGMVLGLVIGLFLASLLSTAVYTVMEFVSALTQDEAIMDVYNNSYIFKFIKDISLFEYIRGVKL